ncbi:pentatricopeptide repeat-containing protein At2g13600 isoform X1 [Ricinus communis]|uniref:pentatricopeptide repeat-containing protein At2g13600 isoform X1 n=1 Tax=Ricinus communis TaxID=3988 RepID=UPI00201ADF3A|nr:pentatricopeptide repeat-containing protein At2g13600 isoform X1 [Ricinus communis]
MLMKSLPGKWKHNRWKVVKCYSTHVHVSRSDDPCTVSTNIAITRYAIKGQLDFARCLFDKMPQRTSVSWNTMISSYLKWGKFKESFSLLSLMHRSNTQLDETTFSTILSVCTRTQSFCDGKQIHCLVLKSGCGSFELVGSVLLYFYGNCSQIDDAKRVFDELHDKNEVVWSSMVVCYVQRGLLTDAYDLFVKMPKKEVVSWSKLISGYAKSEVRSEKALELFQLMRESGEVLPNEFTLDSVIRVCGKLGALSEGMVVHGILIKTGFEFDQSISGALVQFYCDCEAIDDAKRIYDGIAYPCSSASNSLIEGYVLLGRIKDADLIFNRATEKNSALCNLMVKAYSMSGRVEDSKTLFEKMPQKTIISSNTMISVYSRNGELDKALMLFEQTKDQRNPVTWNSMLSGYVQNEQHEEALKLYVTMKRSSVDCTRSTFSVLFRACSYIGSLQQGKMLHANLIKTPFASNVYVGTSLVDMYSKCGSIFDAKNSFSSISAPNVAAWTALINGYAHHGFGSEAILLFQHMLEQKVVPNGATFVGILTACDRAGLVNEGMNFFLSMDEIYGVTPTLEHYACVVGLLGRSGRLLEAEEFIKAMPIEADGVIWAALLSACWFWVDMEVGERVAEQIFHTHPKPKSAYVILSNIYAALGKWGKKMNMRNRLRNLEVKKDPGCSWIELNNRLHVFSVENRSHPHCNVIYPTLEHLSVNLISTVQFNSGSSLLKMMVCFSATCDY